MKKARAMVSQLRKTLYHAENFTEIAEVYYKLVQEESFTDTTKPSQNEHFRRLFFRVAYQALPHSLFVLQGCRYSPRFKLYFGGASIGDYIGNMFYFKDIQKGLVIMADSLGDTKFARVSPPGDKLVEEPVMVNLDDLKVKEIVIKNEP